MKDYYQIMGLEQTASDADIKRTFRKLAVRYHPDKNPTSEAEALFKEINEAYEVLGDSVSRAQYDQRVANPFTYVVETEPVHRDPAYRRRSPARPRPSGPSERTLFLQSMLKFTQVLFYFGCVWCFVLLIDISLPARVIREKVVTDLLNRPRNHHDLLVTSTGHHFPLMITELKHFPHESNIMIHCSPIFGAVVKVENYNRTYVVNNLATIYRNFSFAPILLLLTCMVGILIPKGVEFHVNLGIVVFLLILLNIVFLFYSDL